jgi:hypothetical protein
MTASWPPFLLVSNLFDAPGFFADQLFQAVEHIGDDARGVVGEVDQVAFAVFKNLELETVLAVRRDQNPVDVLDAPPVGRKITVLAKQSV